MIPYVDIAAQHAPLKEKLLAAVAAVIDSGHFILGPRGEEFEKRFAALCGVDHAVAVHSGTDALILALRTVGVAAGDEVITAPNSFISTASSIKIVGATPVFVDVGEDYNLDAGKLEAAVTDKTKAILPVHLTGQTADMDPILAVADKHNIAVIEDCAQAVLASNGGRRSGSMGTLGCFSLHPLKTLNACGDGGVLTTNDKKLADRVRLLRNMGLKSRDECVEWSANSRLDEVQAAMLLVKLDCLEAWTKKRQKNAAMYREGLAGIKGIT
ncbi:MAG: cell wall biogenesis protein, partial [Elusimicrobia bacterium]